MTTLAKPTFNKYEIYGILANYNWITKEANRIKLQLNSVESCGVAVYSDEPKGGNSISNRVESEVIRREKKVNRYAQYMNKIVFIEERSDNIVDEKEKAVLDCMLDGMRLNAIAIHLNMSRKNVHTLRDNIVNGLSDEIA